MGKLEQKTIFLPVFRVVRSRNGSFDSSVDSTAVISVRVLLSLLLALLPAAQAYRAEWTQTNTSIRQFS